MSPLQETTSSLLQDLIATWPKLARFFVALFMIFPFLIASWDKGVQVGWIPDARQSLLTEIIIQHQQQIITQAHQTEILRANQGLISANQDGIKNNQVLTLRSGEKNFQALVANCFVGSKNKDDLTRCETLSRTGKGD